MFVALAATALMTLIKDICYTLANVIVSLLLQATASNGRTKHT